MLLNAKQTAKKMGITYATFVYWKKTHPENLPTPVRFNGGADRYDENDIQAFIDSRKGNLVQTASTSASKAEDGGSNPPDPE